MLGDVNPKFVLGIACPAFAARVRAGGVHHSTERHRVVGRVRDQEGVLIVQRSCNLPPSQLVQRPVDHKQQLVQRRLIVAVLRNRVGADEAFDGVGVTSLDIRAGGQHYIPRLVGALAESFPDGE